MKNKALPKHNFLEGDISPQLRHLAIPMVWGILSINLFTIADTFYVAQLGTQQLAAMSFTFPVVLIYLGFLFSLSVGTSSIVARAFGRGDMDKVKVYTTSSLLLTVVTVLITSTIGFLTIDPVFRLLGAGEQTLSFIHEYMVVWYAGQIFLALPMVGNAAIRGSGDTRFPAAIMSLASVLNIIIDPFLIFGWAGLPRLEMTGAALTTVISYAFTMCVGLYVLHYKKQMMTFALTVQDVLSAWTKTLYIAVPAMFSNLITPVSAAVITWMVADYGKEAVAALGIATRIESLSGVVFYALTIGAGIFIGQNAGAGNYGRIHQVLGIAVRYIMVWGVFLAIVMALGAREIPSWFDDNPDVVAYAAQYMYIVPISFGLMGLVVLTGGAFNAVGKPLPATLLMVMRAFAVYVPLAWLGQHWLGFTGIMLATAATNIIVGAIAWTWGIAGSFKPSSD